MFWLNYSLIYRVSASEHFVTLHLVLLSSPWSLRIRLHTTFFALLDSRNSNLRLFSIFVCFIINTSTQPSPKWQYGDIPFGLREHAQDTLAPLTIKNFPWNVFHSVKKQHFISYYMIILFTYLSYLKYSLCSHVCVCMKNQIFFYCGCLYTYTFKYKCKSLVI